MGTDRDVSAMREDYRKRELSDAAFPDGPVEGFARWFDEARQASEVAEPNACVLSSVDSDGRPRGRVVLLKMFDERGFTFFTNYGSHKATELERTPYASLTFLWLGMERQVRIEGSVARVPRAESEKYFDTRPRASQLGAVASDQSRAIASREKLEARFAAVEREAGDRPISCPEDWGGYIVEPDRIEFWQGRTGRMHDRLVFERRSNDGLWARQRLMP